MLQSLSVNTAIAAKPVATTAVKTLQPSNSVIGQPIQTTASLPVMTNTAISQPVQSTATMPMVSFTDLPLTVQTAVIMPVLVAQLPKAEPQPMPVKPPVAVPPKPVEVKNKNTMEAIDKIMKKLSDGVFTKEEQDLIKKHVGPNGLSLDTIKKIAALKPGDPAALKILLADPYYAKLGFVDKFKLGQALNKITATYDAAMKDLKAALKKDGYSDAQIDEIIKLTTQYMIEFALGTMAGLEEVDDTVSAGIITSTPLWAALNHLSNIMKDTNKYDEIIKELKDSLQKPEKKEEKKELEKKSMDAVPMKK